MYGHKVLIGIETLLPMESSYKDLLTQQNNGEVIKELPNIDCGDYVRSLVIISAIFDSNICNLIAYMKQPSNDQSTYYMLMYDEDTDIAYKYGSLETVLDLTVESELITKYSMKYTIPGNTDTDNTNDDEEIDDSTNEEDNDVNIVEVTP